MPEQMMDEFDRWAVRIFKAVAVLFLLVLTLLAIAVCVDDGDTMRHRPPVVQPSGAEERWIEQRHKHHNIWISVEEPGSKPYFYRDGKKCKL